MPVDPVYLRRHYSLLSDDALLAIDPEDLVDDARRIYDEELKQRKQTRPRAEATPNAAKPDAAKLDRAKPDRAKADDDAGSAAEDRKRHDSQIGDEPEPDWIDDATVATTFYSYPGDDTAGEVDEARSALETAGIPCHLSAHEPEPRRRQPEMEYRLMVPAKLNLEAASLLEQRVFNEDYVDTWKAHFQELSEEELGEVDLDLIFGGLMDRIEQIREAYSVELDQRKAKPRR